MEKYAVAFALAVILTSGAAAENKGDAPSLEGMFAVGNGLPGPSLEIRSIMTNPEMLIAGEPFDAIIDVTNTGSKPFVGAVSAAFEITVSNSGKTNTFLRTFGLDDPIMPDGERRLLNRLLGQPEGEYTLTVTLTNASGERSATGEAGNERSVTLKVMPRALLSTAKTPEKQGPPLWLYALAAILVAALLIAFVVIYYKKLKPGAAAEATRGASAESGSKLTELYKTRDEIEQMIKIAKVKYYKRTLDEESYKEIVREHQQKLIEIEARIAKMEGTIKELQGQIKKGN